MDSKEYLKEMVTIQTSILDFIDQDENSEFYFQKLILFIEDQKFQTNKQNLKLLLHFLLKISKNHYRNSNFFNKIERIILQYKKEISEFFLNSEIFKIFKGSKRILLFLIEERIMILDKHIATKIVTNDKCSDAKYLEYFLPEIKQVLDDFNYKKIPENFEEKRRIGENDDSLCEMIRNDLIEDFISYVNKTNFPLESKISQSIYETNSMLMKNHAVTLIEYAAFFGSLQIFQYLVINKVKLNEKLLLYAIHGKNAEIIKIIEENGTKPDINSINEYLLESMKCHHNDITNYIKDSYLKIDKLYAFTSPAIKYYNFAFIQNDSLKMPSYFYDLCQYEYHYLVDFLLKTEDIDVNQKIISKQIFFFHSILK